MAYAWLMIVRLIASIFAIIELGLTAYAVHYAVTFYYRDPYGDYEVAGSSPSQLNFLLFASIWTLLANLYLEVTPRFAPSLAHKYAVAGVDIVTALFWFAGFVALAVLVGGPDCRGNGFCEVVETSIALGALLWALFMVALIVDVLHIWRTRNMGEKKAPEAVTY